VRPGAKRVLPKGAAIGAAQGREALEAAAAALPRVTARRALLPWL